MNPIKYPFLWLTYAWLRFDPVLWITFKGDWKPRYDFMAAIFGQVDTTQFLDNRVELVKLRNRPQTPIIISSLVNREADRFFKADLKSKAGREKRLEIIKRLIFWCTDEAINQVNIDSYLTRMTIIDTLFNQMFQNSLVAEGELIMTGLRPIVFSRITHTTHKGEPSPLVHDVIIKAGGSLAFSADLTKKYEFQHKFPLPKGQVKLLNEILKHYSHSGWPDSREQAEDIIKMISVDLGFDIN